MSKPEVAIPCNDSFFSCTVLLLINLNVCPNLYGFSDALGNLVSQMHQSATRVDKMFEYLL